MEYDIFFSISQTPVDGHTPTEAEMFRNFYQQVEAADELGYGVAWIAQSNLSTQVQKKNKKPVVPHWKGEVGLNGDVFQLAHTVFRRTNRIEVGSAVMNLLVMGGPVGAAERVATFSALHGVDPEEKRRLHVGFSAGRFDFMSRAYGIVARDEVEERAWPALKGQVFMEATEIFLRLLRGEVVNSDQIRTTTLTRANFRSDEDWEAVRSAAAERDGTTAEEISEIPIPRRFEFEDIMVIPQDWRRDLVQLIVGSHDPNLQAFANSLMPVQVFNLSITRAEVINATHDRMTENYHADGGDWKRSYMPRTVMVFLNEEENLTPEERTAAAKVESRKALEAYWTALEGTLDPAKIERATDNAVIGNAEQVAAQMKERFDPRDRIMLWFDFFNHDSDRVVRNMTAFMEKVRPLLEQ